MTASSVPWLGTEDAAHYVGLGVNAFRLLVKRREIAAIRDGGHPRFLRTDLDAYLARKRQPAKWEANPRPKVEREPTPIRLPDGINDITGRPFGETTTPVAASSAAGRGRSTGKRKAALSGN